MISLFKNDCKRLTNIAVLLTGFLTFGYLLTAFSPMKKMVLPYTLLYIVLSVAIIAIPITSFSYLHDRSTGTHLLSLPFTKGQIVLTKFLSGLTVLMVPSIVYVGVICITKQVSFMDAIVPVILFILMYYLLGCLVANITGTTAMHIFLFIAIALLPLLMYVSLNAVFSQYVRGMQENNLLQSIIYILMPATNIVQSSIHGFLPFESTMIYSIYIAILVFVNIVVSSRRPFEKIGEAIAYHRIDSIIKILIIVSFTWILTAFLSFNDHILISCFIATATVIAIVELLLYRKIHYKQAGVQLVCIFVFTIAIFFMAASYLENYIPSKIDSASVTIYQFYDVDVAKPKAVSSETAKETIRDIHQYLIDHESENEQGDQFVKVTYALTSGDYMTRSYHLDTASYRTVVNKMVTSEAKEEIVSNYFAVFEKIATKEIESISTSQVEKAILDSKEIQKFKELLKTQLKRFKQHPELFDEIKFFDGNTRYIEILDKQNKSNIYVLYKNDPVYLAFEKFNQEKKAN